MFVIFGFLSRGPLKHTDLKGRYVLGVSIHDVKFINEFNGNVVFAALASSSQLDSFEALDAPTLSIKKSTRFNKKEKRTNVTDRHVYRHNKNLSLTPKNWKQHIGRKGKIIALVVKKSSEN